MLESHYAGDREATNFYQQASGKSRGVKYGVLKLLLTLAHELANQVLKRQK